MPVDEICRSTLSGSARDQVVAVDNAGAIGALGALAVITPAPLWRRATSNYKVLGMKKFNGWQRLWVVASMVALPFTIIAWHHDFSRNFPTEESAREAALDRALELVRVPVDEVEYKRCLAREMPSGGAPLSKLQAFMAACREELGGRPSPEAVRKGEQAMSDVEDYIGSGLRADQAKALLVPLGAWIALCILVYLAGAAIAWVIKGFRSPKAEA